MVADPVFHGLPTHGALNHLGSIFGLHASSGEAGSCCWHKRVCATCTEPHSACRHADAAHCRAAKPGEAPALLLLSVRCTDCSHRLDTGIPEQAAPHGRQSGSHGALALLMAQRQQQQPAQKEVSCQSQSEASLCACVCRVQGPCVWV